MTRYDFLEDRRLIMSNVWINSQLDKITILVNVRMWIRAYNDLIRLPWGQTNNFLSLLQCDLFSHCCQLSMLIGANNNQTSLRPDEWFLTMFAPFQLDRITLLVNLCMCIGPNSDLIWLRKVVFGSKSLVVILCRHLLGKLWNQGIMTTKTLRHIAISISFQWYSFVFNKMQSRLVSF